MGDSRVFSKEEIEQMQELINNRPTYPDLDALIASGDLEKVRGGYRPLTKHGMDSIQFFVISATVDTKTNSAVFKLSRRRKRDI